jgi:pyrimidine deaminase RibD-like protein
MAIESVVGTDCCCRSHLSPSTCVIETSVDLGETLVDPADVAGVANDRAGHLAVTSQLALVSVEPCSLLGDTPICAIGDFQQPSCYSVVRRCHFQTSSV